MARLQILELPVEHHGDDMVTPFVLVIDQWEPPPYPADVTAPGPFDGIAEKIGARAVLAFEETVEIPENAPQVVTEVTEEHAGTPQIVYAHERTRLDLCSALLVDSGTPWRTLIKHVTERQQELAGLYRKLDARVELMAVDPKVASLAQQVLAIDLTVACPSDVEAALYQACRELEKSEAARAHLRREHDALGARIRQVQQASTEPEVMNAQQEHPSVWRHGYHCGVLAAKAALRPRDEKTSKP